MSRFAVQLQSPVCCYKGRMRRSVGGDSGRFGVPYTGHLSVGGNARGPEIASQLDM